MTRTFFYKLLKVRGKQITQCKKSFLFCTNPSLFFDKQLFEFPSSKECGVEFFGKPRERFLYVFSSFPYSLL